MRKDFEPHLSFDSSCVRTENYKTNTNQITDPSIDLCFDTEVQKVFNGKLLAFYIERERKYLNFELKDLTGQYFSLNYQFRNMVSFT